MKREMRWDCKRDGCFNEKARLKFHIFSDCFPEGSKIDFTDNDAEVDVRGHFLMMEWTLGGIKQAGQERWLKNKSKLKDPMGWTVICILVDGNAGTADIRKWRVLINGIWQEWNESPLYELKAYIKAWAENAYRNPIAGA